jgi:hypothetical protein
MISGWYKNSSGELIATTTGCGCCSGEYYIETDKEEILAELKRNIKVLEQSCINLGYENIEELKKAIGE